MVQSAGKQFFKNCNYKSSKMIKGIIHSFLFEAADLIDVAFQNVVDYLPLLQRFNFKISAVIKIETGILARIANVLNQAVFYAVYGDVLFFKEL